MTRTYTAHAEPLGVTLKIENEQDRVCLTRNINHQVEALLAPYWLDSWRVVIAEADTRVRERATYKAIVKCKEDGKSGMLTTRTALYVQQLERRELNAIPKVVSYGHYDGTDNRQNAQDEYPVDDETRQAEYVSMRGSHCVNNAEGLLKPCLYTEAGRLAPRSQKVVRMEHLHDTFKPDYTLLDD